MKLIQQQFETSNIHLDLLKDCNEVYLIPETRLAWVNWMTAYFFGREDGRMFAVKQHEPVEPTCQVRNLDTGVTETLMQENAKLLQAKTRKKCDWVTPLGTWYR